MEKTRGKFCNFAFTENLKTNYLNFSFIKNRGKIIWRVSKRNEYLKFRFTKNLLKAEKIF